MGSHTNLRQVIAGDAHSRIISQGNARINPRSSMITPVVAVTTRKKEEAAITTTTATVEEEEEAEEGAIMTTSRANKGTLQQSLHNNHNSRHFNHNSNTTHKTQPHPHIKHTFPHYTTEMGRCFNNQRHLRQQISSEQTQQALREGQHHLTI